MRHTTAIVLRALIAVAFLAAAGPAVAQGPQNLPGQKAEEVYKNIAALRGMPASEFNQTMHLMEAETGMDCFYCHVQGANEKDDKQPKQIARRMILMMNSINQANFGGQRVVTCYTCHNGQPIPKSVPTELPTPRPVRTDPPISSPRVAALSVDQILAKYVEALGGEQALRKVTTRVIAGTQTLPSGPGGQVPVPAALERVQKAPNLVVSTYRTPTGTTADGFDGTKAWTMGGQGRVTEPAGFDQDRARREADLYWPLNLKQSYTKLEAKGLERVNDRDAYLVVATTQGGDLPEKLYFDALTGVLLRKESALHTPVGDSPYQVDFADYRDTNSGVKFPFQITMSPASARSVLFSTAILRVTSVQDNVEIEAAKLARPESAPAPPAGAGPAGGGRGGAGRGGAGRGGAGPAQ